MVLKGREREKVLEYLRNMSKIDDVDIITVHGSDSEPDSDADTAGSRSLGEDDTESGTTTDTAPEDNHERLPPPVCPGHLPELLLSPERIVSAITTAFQQAVNENLHNHPVIVTMFVMEEIWSHRLCCWSCQRNTPRLRSMTREFMESHVENAVVEALCREPQNLNTFEIFRYVTRAMLSVGSFGDLIRECPCLTCI